MEDQNKDFNIYIDELRKKLIENHFEKKSEWEKVYNSKQYQQELKYLKDISLDFIQSLRILAFYSTRGGKIYDDFLSIRLIDDLLQSGIAIQYLTENGIHNSVRRELRYLIERVSKYVYIDYEKMSTTLSEKNDFLKNEVPNSSIEIIDKYSTPFIGNEKTEYRNEIRDFFYKTCAYVHPSKKQIDEQLTNYENGNNIGFESAKMFEKINKDIFRAYDIILVMIFHVFGYSMSKDLFEQVFNDNLKWKYHKGKYIKIFKKSYLKIN